MGEKTSVLNDEPEDGYINKIPKVNAPHQSCYCSDRQPVIKLAAVLNIIHAIFMLG